jgi:hypothetical protein
MGPTVQEPSYRIAHFGKPQYACLIANQLTVIPPERYTRESPFELLSRVLSGSPANRTFRPGRRVSRCSDGHYGSSRFTRSRSCSGRHSKFPAMSGLLAPCSPRTRSNRFSLLQKLFRKRKLYQYLPTTAEISSGTVDREGVLELIGGSSHREPWRSLRCWRHPWLLTVLQPDVDPLTVVPS